MGAQYFLDIRGHNEGPYSFDQLASMWRDKIVSPETLYAVDGASAWQPLSVLFTGPAPPLIPAQSIPVAPAPQNMIIARRKDWFCAQCHTVGVPEWQTQGSFFIEIALYLLFCAPGLIYTIWRLTSKKRICPACHSTAIIRANSPAASQWVQIR
jgi:hypothetical protein